MSRSMNSFAISGSVIIASILAVTATSIAAPVVETYQNVVTKFCLDSNDFRQVYTHRCNGGSYQKWQVIRSGDTRILKNVETRSCLDSNAARQVYTHGCNGGSYQKWKAIRSGNAIVFQNVVTKLCLDSNAARQVYTHPCGSEYQKWR